MFLVAETAAMTVRLDVREREEGGWGELVQGKGEGKGTHGDAILEVVSGRGEGEVEGG